MTMRRAFVGLALAILCGCGKEESVSPAAPAWPPLSGQGCISGRAATTPDVDAGNAVFVLQADGKPIGKPLAIKIPQYANHIDEKTKQRSPCVVIQAEEVRGSRLIGARTVPKGELLAGIEAEFELLGEHPPK